MPSATRWRRSNVTRSNASGCSLENGRRALNNVAADNRDETGSAVRGTMQIASRCLAVNILKRGLVTTDSVSGWRMGSGLAVIEHAVTVKKGERENVRREIATTAPDRARRAQGVSSGAVSGSKGAAVAVLRAAAPGQ